MLKLLLELLVSRLAVSCRFAQELLLLSLLLLLQLELTVAPLLPTMPCLNVFLLLPLPFLLLLLSLEQNIPTLLLLRRPRVRSSRPTSALLPGSSRSVPRRLLLYELRDVGNSFPRRGHSASFYLLDAEPLLLAPRVGGGRRGVRSLALLARR